MHVYQSREFLDVWLNTIGHARQIEAFFFVVCDSSDRPVLYLPLGIETRFNYRLPRFLDAGVADYNGPILCRASTISRVEFEIIWSKILSQLPRFDAIDLQKIAGKVLDQINPITHLECVPYHESGHAIQLSSLRSEVNGRRSVARLRKNLRRFDARLKNTSDTDFVVNPFGNELNRLVERLLELKRHKYARTLGGDFLAMAGIEDFYREMMVPDRLGKISHISALNSVPLSRPRISASSAAIGFTTSFPHSISPIANFGLAIFCCSISSTRRSRTNSSRSTWVSVTFPTRIIGRRTGWRCIRISGRCHRQATYI